MYNFIFCIKVQISWLSKHEAQRFWATRCFLIGICRHEIFRLQVSPQIKNICIAHVYALDGHYSSLTKEFPKSESPFYTGISSQRISKSQGLP